MFYAHDKQIAGHRLIWVQTALTAMVIMFERVGLQKNIRNTKSKVCTTGFIWGQQVVEAYRKRATG